MFRKFPNELPWQLIPQHSVNRMVESIRGLFEKTPKPAVPCKGLAVGAAAVG